MPFKTYLTQLSAALKRGDATEHTHRPALKHLIEALGTQLGQDLTATNEPKRIACGAPDFIITHKSTPLGYIEAKDVNVDLDKTENDEQLKRYRASLRNLILTDYLEFRLYRNGELINTTRLAKWQKNGVLKSDPAGINATQELLTRFIQSDLPSVARPRELAERMAQLARMIRSLISQAFLQEGERGELHTQFDGFRKVLLGDDLQPAQFADMYAQTICYGLFAARCNHVGTAFTRQGAAYELPKTNPFLRKLFQSIAGADLDERIAWAVDDLADLLARADMAAILTDFGKATRQEDPVVHFYESFLAAYDPKLRESRGVYYTPEPVVSYIVRSVDAILKRDFELPLGLADNSKVTVKRPTGKLNSKGEAQTETMQAHRVQILDPATGTGTFLYSVIAHIRETFSGNQGMWPGYVAEHLLPRIFGFELLMAPYAVAHMKLGLQLKDSGYDFASDERLRVYLTNTLEKAHELSGLPLFAQWLAEEAMQASEVKQNAPIMVVLGNPPYSGHSINTGEWISSLLRGVDTLSNKTTGNYFAVDGAKLNERNPKWLNDDYVKFIRFAQWRIEQTGHGILAFVTNHGYLDNPTFRGMRQSLLQTFDTIYLLDLHGNSKKKEKAEDGSKDENVFDIMQGVAIGLFVKRPATKVENKADAVVQHAELFGLRDGKYQWLWEHDVLNTQWATLTPQTPNYLLVPQDKTLLVEYELGWKVTEAFPVNVLGFQTHRDDFAIDFERTKLVSRIEEMRETKLSDAEFSERYEISDSGDWQLAPARKALRKDAAWKDKIIQCAYRPFDNRWSYFSEVAMDRPRRELKEHVFNRPNYCLLAPRQIGLLPWQHVAMSEVIAESCAISTKTKEQNYVFPLYLYSGQKKSDLFDQNMPTDVPDGRRPNLAPDFIAAISAKLQLTFIPDACGDLITNFGPEDIFHYAYAVFYSPTYRSRYAQFLKIDFPRLPLTADIKLFSTLCKLGRELVGLHLLDAAAIARLPMLSRYPIAGSNRVEKVSFESDAERLGTVLPDSAVATGRVHINAEQYFDNVPCSVWNYHIGGYQVAHKWLKDRKGRLLSFDDCLHYQRIIAALAETIRLQTEIDAAIPGWPLM